MTTTLAEAQVEPKSAKDVEDATKSSRSLLNTINGYLDHFRTKAGLRKQLEGLRERLIDNGIEDERVIAAINQEDPQVYLEGYLDWLIQDTWERAGNESRYNLETTQELRVQEQAAAEGIPLPGLEGIDSSQADEYNETAALLNFGSKIARLEQILPDPNNSKLGELVQIRIKQLIGERISDAKLADIIASSQAAGATEGLLVLGKYLPENEGREHRQRIISALLETGKPEVPHGARLAQLIDQEYAEARPDSDEWEELELFALRACEPDLAVDAQLLDSTAIRKAILKMNARELQTDQSEPSFLHRNLTSTELMGKRPLAYAKILDMTADFNMDYFIQDGLRQRVPTENLLEFVKAGIQGAYDPTQREPLMTGIAQAINKFAYTKAQIERGLTETNKYEYEQHIRGLAADIRSLVVVCTVEPGTLQGGGFEDLRRTLLGIFKSQYTSGEGQEEPRLQARILDCLTEYELGELTYDETLDYLGNNPKIIEHVAPDTAAILKTQLDRGYQALLRQDKTPHRDIEFASVQTG